MYNRSDPRFRRTLNTISHNLESANETAQVGLFSLSEHCLKPVFFSVGNCITTTGSTCFPTSRDDKRPRRKPRARGRPELNFDFYDDWQEDENDALLAWGNEEYDALLGEENTDARGEPSRRGIMNYGSQGGAVDPKDRARRRSTAQQDPSVIPNSSSFGFLDCLPFRSRAKELRYRPSAAGLQERPKGRRKAEGALGGGREDDSISGVRAERKHGRKRSATVGSGHTTDSYSSRGDIFLSDEDMDDAVPFDDEFAAELVPSHDDASSGKTTGGRRMSRTTPSTRSKKSSNASSRRVSQGNLEAMASSPDGGELKGAGQAMQAHDERNMKALRDAAMTLAIEPGHNDEEGHAV